MNEQNPDRSNTDNRPASLSDMLSIYEQIAKARGLAFGTLRSTRNCMSTIFRYIPSCTDINDVTSDSYYDMIYQMREDGLKESSIKTYTNCLRKIIRLADSRRMLKDNFFDHVYPDARIQRTPVDSDISSRLVTKEEFNSLMRLLKSHECSACPSLNDRTYLLLFSLLYYSGLRIGEALALCPEDFRACSLSNRGMALQIIVNKTLITKDGESHICRDTKNHKLRLIPLPGKFSEQYNSYLMEMKRHRKSQAKSDRLFPMSYNAVYRSLLKFCEEAGVRRHTPHDFRYTYISNLISAGLPVNTAAFFSGDTEAVILSTYSHVTEDYMMQLIGALNKIAT